MKLSELNVGTEYAVIPSWTYTSRGARDIDTVRENDVVRATLLSKVRYEYEASHRKSSETEFTVAEAGNRSVGVLVKATDSNGKEIYWTSRLADIVAPYSQLEPKWVQEKTDAEKKEEEQRIIRQKIQQHEREIEAYVENVKGSITTSCKELLGESCGVTVETTGWHLDKKAIVTITVREFERLIELAYEGKASVA